MPKIDLRLITEENLYQLFVEPFVDVARAGKLAVMSVANPLAALAKSIITFSPKAMDELLANYKSRRDAITSEWNELSNRIKSDMTPDAQLIAFLSAPDMYLSSIVMKAVGSSAADIGLSATGLGQAIANATGNSWDRFKGAMESPPVLAGAEAGAAIPGTLGALARIFFLAHHQRSGRMLSEDAPPRKLDRNQVVDIMNTELDILGASDDIQKSFDELYKLNAAAISKLKKMAENYIKLKSGLADIQSYNDLQTFVQKAVQSDMMGSSEAQQMMNDIKKAAADLAEDEDYLQSMPDNLKSEPKKSALESTVGIFKQKLIEQIDDLKEPLAAVYDSISSSIPKAADLKKLPQNDNVKKLVALRRELNDISQFR